MRACVCVRACACVRACVCVCVCVCAIHIIIYIMIFNGSFGSKVVQEPVINRCSSLNYFGSQIRSKLLGKQVGVIVRHEGGRAGIFCNSCLNNLSVTVTVTVTAIILQVMAVSIVFIDMMQYRH